MASSAVPTPPHSAIFAYALWSLASFAVCISHIKHAAASGFRFFEHPRPRGISRTPFVYSTSVTVPCNHHPLIYIYLGLFYKHCTLLLLLYLISRSTNTYPLSTSVLHIYILATASTTLHIQRSPPNAYYKLLAS